jgi:hypothetical protein
LTDNLGDHSTNSVTIIVNELPAVAISAPADGSGFIAPATFTVSASATGLRRHRRASAVSAGHHGDWVV